MSIFDIFSRKSKGPDPKEVYENFRAFIERFKKALPQEIYAPEGQASAEAIIVKPHKKGGNDALKDNIVSATIIFKPHDAHMQQEFIIKAHHTGNATLYGKRGGTDTKVCESEPLKKVEETLIDQTAEILGLRYGVSEYRAPFVKQKDAILNGPKPDEPSLRND